ncbi:MAG: calcium-translocating P-type ATPase, PMCA-type, partial [Kiritimatiellaeota bacterium]|nr:calcium-translocating P-type ATPase, PMCA-type [Kiritimatiellota bacterium]
EIVVGDILLLATGDKIPADGRLLESHGLCADESALTGESAPVEKDAERVLTDERTPLAERVNMLYAGTYVTGGFGKLLVTAVGDATEFGKIAQGLHSKERTTTPLQERLGRLGKTITLFGAIAAAVVFVAQLVNLSRHGGLALADVMEAFVTSIILIVAAVPEGLPTIVAVSLSINIIKLSRQNALVKKIIASETVGNINVICSDKTGTLTENRMTVVGDITSERVLRNACVNSTADIGEGGAFIGNATECALLVAADKRGWNYRDCRRSAEIVHVFPFSSDKKCMTTLVRAPGGSIAYSKGSPERILRSCDMPDRERVAIEQQMLPDQQRACRIIAFAHRVLHAESTEEEIERGMTFDGFVAIADPLRADVFEAVNQCRRAGIDLKILTGDNIVTATAIANELRVLDDTRIAVEAQDIEDIKDAALSEMLPRISVIARSTPGIKMRVVKLLKAAGHTVAVTGDGINDAPALKCADVGIAMGISGTEVSKEVSDIVLLDDAFSTIVNAVCWGRGIYENFKRFISFQLAVNVSAVCVMLTAVVLGFKAPFTALQLLWINIIMDGPPALTLGLEPVRGDLMSHPPVKRSENILSGPLLARIGITGLYISVVVLSQYAFDFLGGGPEQMPTILFALFTLFHLFNAFNCRELHRESIFRHLLSNRLMLGVMGITFVLHVLLIQYAGAFFGTLPLPPALWVKLFLVASSVVAFQELAKLGRRAISP